MKSREKVGTKYEYLDFSYELMTMEKTSTLEFGFRPFVGRG